MIGSLPRRPVHPEENASGGAPCEKSESLSSSQPKVNLSECTRTRHATANLHCQLSESKAWSSALSIPCSACVDAGKVRAFARKTRVSTRTSGRKKGSGRRCELAHLDVVSHYALPDLTLTIGRRDRRNAAEMNTHLVGRRFEWGMERVQLQHHSPVQQQLTGAVSIRGC